MKQTHQDVPLTLNGTPMKVSSNSPRNFLSSRSSVYLLQGPRVGSLVMSEKEEVGERRERKLRAVTCTYYMRTLLISKEAT